MKTLSAHPKRRRVLFTTLLVLLLPLLASVFGSRRGTAQAPPKEERELGEHIPKHLPIKVKVKKEEKLKDSENDDWLRDVEVEVTNTGTKPIYFVKLSLLLPDVFADDERGTLYNLYYGRRELFVFEERVRPDDVPLMPGESATLRVYDIENEMVSWKHFRAKGRLRNPKKLHLRFQEINFGDGTGFVGTEGTAIPEKRERSSNGQCRDGDEGAAKPAASNPPPRYFIDLAYSPTKYLSPPVSFMTAAFFVGNSSPEPPTKRDVCCPVANCSRVKSD